VDLVTIKTRRLNELIKEMGRNELSSLLTRFGCSRNRDSEDFLKNTSFRHDKRDISRTYLVMDEDEQRIIGFFTLALKCLALSEADVGPDVARSMNLKDGVVQANLIGQLARTDDAVPGLGRMMIDEALKAFSRGKEMFGCRMVRLDCKNEPIDYYTSYGFQIIGKNHDKDLNQMAVFM
jgi:predicted GNAT family N-acyltransferase